MLDRVKAGTPLPGMRQRELVVGPGIVGSYMKNLDLLYFKPLYVKSNFI